jgi:hypothetical protein
MFMINLLPLQTELVLGITPATTIATTLQDEFQFTLYEDTFRNVLYSSNGSKVINKLRLLWSCQKLYLYKYSMLVFILPELKRLRFGGVEGGQHTKISKEIHLLLNSAFSG